MHHTGAMPSVYSEGVALLCTYCEGVALPRYSVHRMRTVLIHQPSVRVLRGHALPVTLSSVCCMLVLRGRALYCISKHCALGSSKDVHPLSGAGHVLTLRHRIDSVHCLSGVRCPSSGDTVPYVLCDVMQ